MDDLKNKRVTVAGLGHFGGGIAVARWLVEQGAKVLVTDLGSAEKLAHSVEQLAGLPIKFRLGEHRGSDFTDCDLVVTSPALPPTNEFLNAARAAEVPITTEIRLFLERCKANRVIGVTGTKGKSTTTSMLGLLLKTRYTTWVGGNIGKSLLADLPDIKAGDIVLLELSSYMLEYLRPMKWSPQIAVITLISNDHTEWHGSAEAYLDAKLNMLRYQKEEDTAVLPADSDFTPQFEAITNAKILYYPNDRHPPFKLQLPGAHNQLNAQAAYAVAEKLWVSWNDAQAVLKDFAGLPHRMQLVHQADRIRYYNDSIATIPEAAIVACESFEVGKVIQIIGGSDKKLDMQQMCQTLAERCKAVLTIGAIGSTLAEMCGSNAEQCLTLQRAVQRAKEMAKPGDVVLLSTGCASYDQFTNFEHRGDEFTRLAKEK